MDLLLEDRNEFLKVALSRYDKTQDDLNKYVEIIRDWIKLNKNIPEIPEDNVLVNFLLMNKFDVEKVKPKLEMYYSVRTQLPDFFHNKHPDLPHMQEVVNKTYFIPLPKLTEENYRVSVVKIVDADPSNFQVYDFFAHTYNVTEVRLHEDVTMGDILVYDLCNLKVGHFFKLTPFVLRKTSFILEKVYSNRVKQIHILNSPRYAAATISLTKAIMKPKMASRIHVHKDMDSILKYISPKILPSDYGGNELSMNELNEMWKAKLAKYKERFNTLEAIGIKGQSKLTPLINEEVLGFQENFGKLDID